MVHEQKYKPAMLREQPTIKHMFWMDPLLY